MRKRYVLQGMVDTLTLTPCLLRGWILYKFHITNMLNG